MTLRLFHFVNHSSISDLHSRKTDAEKKRIVDSFPCLNPEASLEEIKNLLHLIDQIQQAVNSSSMEETKLYFEEELLRSNALPQESRNSAQQLLEDLILAATHTSVARNLKSAPYQFFHCINRTQTICDIQSKLKKNYLVDQGSLYIGETKSGKRHGKGRLTNADHVIYEASWQNNQQIGPGTIKVPGKHACTYEVTWTKKGSISAKAKIKWDDGTVYEGALSHFVPHNYGKKTFPDGRVYEGEWTNGETDGFGTMTYPNAIGLKGTWYHDVLKKWEPTIPRPKTREQSDQHTYVRSLKRVPNSHKAKGVPIDSILALFKSAVGFDPNELSFRDQIDLVYSHVFDLNWFQEANSAAQDGILKFIQVVKDRCFECRAYNTTPKANTAFMKESLVLFAQFLYFMDSPLIPEKNKQNALKSFSHTAQNPMIFECSQSVPQRIAGILSILKENTIFLDPYRTQRDLLLESFVADFIRIRTNANLPHIIGNQIHFRPWLANFLAQECGFHTSFESTTDPYAQITAENNAIYLMEDPFPPQARMSHTISLDELYFFFSAKIKEYYHAPNVESEVAHFVQLLWPFQHKEKLDPKDLKIIEEQFFDALALNCPELEGLMPKYIVPVDPDDEDCFDYRLSEEVFDDLPFLIALRLVSLRYYSDTPSCSV